MEPDQIDLMNQDELRDELRKLIARPSSCTVDSIVRNMWNHLADGYNQWDSLGRDEKDTLFKIAVANAEHEPRAIASRAPCSCSQSGPGGDA